MDWDGDMESMARMLVFDSLNTPQYFLRERSRENAPPGAREISSEQWQRLNGFITDALASHANPVPIEHQRALTLVVDAFTCSRSKRYDHDSWSGLAVYPPGRYLERAYATATLLEVYQRSFFTRMRRALRLPVP